jgi:hypothetical protein
LFIPEFGFMLCLFIVILLSMIGLRPGAGSDRGKIFARGPRRAYAARRGLLSGRALVLSLHGRLHSSSILLVTKPRPAFIQIAQWKNVASLSKAALGANHMLP